MPQSFLEWMGVATAYAVVAKAFLACTPTPPADTVYGKAYRFIEWTTLVIGKVKQEAGQ